MATALMATAVLRLLMVTVLTVTATGLSMFPGGGPVAREIIETGAANQVGIVEQALEERGNAIADMVRSGMIDIQSAQDLYDRQRAEVYADFLGEQNRIVSQFDAERSAAALERATDRAALEAQLRAAGVNPGLVADEFAMMDEMYRGLVKSRPTIWMRWVALVGCLMPSGR